MVFSDHTWKEFNAEYRSNMRNLDPTKPGTRFNNAIRIDVGSFKGDFGQIMSRWTWELPQTAFGKSYGHLTNNIGRVKGVGYFDGATIVNVTDLPLDGDNSRGVALGSFIYGEGISDNPFETDMNGRLTAGAVLLRHEYGHYRQSQKNGWAYLPKYGIPSANGADWTEIDAEYRSDRYFFTRYGSSPIFSSYSSDYRSIDAKWWEHLLIFGGGYFTGGSVVSIFNLSNPK